jgi:hypothetical protein
MKNKLQEAVTAEDLLTLEPGFDPNNFAITGGLEDDLREYSIDPNKVKSIWDGLLSGDVLYASNPPTYAATANGGEQRAVYVDGEASEEIPLVSLITMVLAENGGNFNPLMTAAEFRDMGPQFEEDAGYQAMIAFLDSNPAAAVGESADGEQDGFEPSDRAFNGCPTLYSMGSEAAMVYDDDFDDAPVRVITFNVDADVEEYEDFPDHKLDAAIAWGQEHGMTFSDAGLAKFRAVVTGAKSEGVLDNGGPYDIEVNPDWSADMQAAARSYLQMADDGEDEKEALQAAANRRRLTTDQYEEIAAYLKNKGAMIESKVADHPGTFDSGEEFMDYVYNTWPSKGTYVECQGGGGTGSWVAGIAGDDHIKGATYDAENKIVRWTDADYDELTETSSKSGRALAPRRHIQTARKEGTKMKTNKRTYRAIKEAKVAPLLRAHRGLRMVREDEMEDNQFFVAVAPEGADAATVTFDGDSMFVGPFDSPEAAMAAVGDDAEVVDSDMNPVDGGDDLGDMAGMAGDGLPMEARRRNAKRIRESVVRRIMREASELEVDTTIDNGKGQAGNLLKSTGGEISGDAGVIDNGSGQLDDAGAPAIATQSAKEIGSSTELDTDTTATLNGDGMDGAPTLNDPLKGGMDRGDDQDLSGAGAGKGSVSESRYGIKRGNLVKVFERSTGKSVDHGVVASVTESGFTLEGDEKYDNGLYEVRKIA